MFESPRTEFEQASKEVAAAGQKIEEFQNKASTERNQFFDKLALLDGGAIVLSVTFIGYLIPKQGTITGRWALYPGWCLLLVSLLLSLLRNFFYQNYHFYARVSPYIRKRSEKIDAEMQVVADPAQVFLAEDGKRILTAKERLEFAEQLKSKAQGYRSEAERVNRRGKIAEYIWRPCEPSALITFFLGLTFLVWFAILNTR